MSAIAFDTHEFYKRLTDVGFSEKQAETITDLQKSTVDRTLEQARHDYELDNLATKRDLKEIEFKIKESELKLEGKIKDIELKFESRMKETDLKIVETKAELIRWVVAVGLLQVTIITALLLKLANHF